MSHAPLQQEMPISIPHQTNQTGSTASSRFLVPAPAMLKFRDRRQMALQSQHAAAQQILVRTFRQVNSRKRTAYGPRLFSL